MVVLWGIVVPHIAHALQCGSVSVWLYACMHACIYGCVFVCLCVWLHLYVPEKERVSVCMSENVQVCMSVCVSVCVCE